MKGESGWIGGMMGMMGMMALMQSGNGSFGDTEYYYTLVMFSTGIVRNGENGSSGGEEILLEICWISIIRARQGCERIMLMVVQGDTVQ